MIRKAQLANGLTILTESMPHVRSVSLGVWLKRGSRHEPAIANGISHFLEHLVFKGTETRTAREIALAMDTIGGQMDAFTTKEYTCFYAKVIDERLPVAVDLLADIVLRPRFDPLEVERERKVILEEIRMVEDTPDELIYDLFADSFYPDHPLGRPIQGTQESVEGLSRRRLKSFFRRAYRAGNILISAAGNLRHAQLARRIEGAFGSLNGGGSPERGGRRPRSVPVVARRSKRELEQLHLMLGIPAFPESHEHRYTLSVINTLLGGTMSSRLFQRIREERGLAYSVYSGVSGFADAGFLMVYAATNPRQGMELLDVTLEELRKLRADGPSAEELEVAKEHLKGSLMLVLESTSSRMSNLARQEIYFGRQFSLKEVLRGIERVTRDGAHEMCRELFRQGPVGVAAVGRLDRFRPGPRRLSL